MPKNKLPVVLSIAIIWILACTISIGPAATPTRNAPPSPTSAPTRATTVTPSPAPAPELRGSLLIYVNLSEIHLLTGLGNGQIKDELLVSDVDSPAPPISPNQRNVVFYSTKQGVSLLDLQSREITNLSKHPSSCFSWSPDSLKFSAHLFSDKTGLYVIDLKGNPDLVYEAPGASYGLTPFGTSTRYGTVTCGVWVDSEHLLFQRFVGEMPATITGPTYSELDANTTSLAEIGNGIKLLDSPERWLEIAACATEPFVLLESNKMLYVSPGFTKFEDLDAKPIQLCPSCDLVHAGSWDHEAGFTGDCRIYYRVMAGFNWRLVFTDPRTLQSQVGPLLEPSDPALKESSLWDFDGVWMGNQNDMLAVIVETEEKTYTHTIGIVNLNTGAVTYLPVGPYDMLDIIAWLPGQP